MEHKTGVSLLEIVAIAAAIIVVALVMVPIIAGARARSSKSACQANMARIAAAIEAYSRDNNGQVPPSQYYADPPTNFDYVHPPIAAPNAPKGRKVLYPELWTGRLRGYLDDAKYFICPLVTEDMARSGYFYHPEPSNERSPWTTYGMNWRFSNGGALGGNPEHPKKAYVGLVQTLDAPPIPSRTILLIETQNRVVRNDKSSDVKPGIREGGNITPYRDAGNYFWAIRWLDRRSFTPFGHKGGCNAVLADGHATFIQTPPPPYPPISSQVERQGLKWW